MKPRREETDEVFDENGDPKSITEAVEKRSCKGKRGLVPDPFRNSILSYLRFIKNGTVSHFKNRTKKSLITVSVP